jgi:predicted dehydrogenase
VVLVGCGLVGRKRAAALAPGQLQVACDVVEARAREVAGHSPGCRVVSGYAEAVACAEATVVVVATTNAELAPVALAAVRAGKHVLVEKPGAVSVAQLEEVQGEAESHGVLVRLGYNHRFHPALLKARELVDAGVLGPLLFLRGRYGHGGRLGYEQEWRADPARSGGGELLDQGVHLIDLAGWFLGDFTRVDGHAVTSYWSMAVDDNAFLSLRTASDQTAWLQVSCTEWKNLFSLELYGRTGKLHVEGLGGSYGVERLTHHRMLPELGPPETTIFEYPRGDDSWRLELQAFFEDLRLGRTPTPGTREGQAVLAVVETIYARSGYPRRSGTP